MDAKNKTLVILRGKPTARICVSAIIGLLVVLLGLTASVAAAYAQEEGVRKVGLTARAGYDGYYKGEHWVPIRVTATNDGPAIEGYLQVVAGSASSNDQVAYRSPISLPSASNKSQTLFVHLSSLVGELAVELVDASGSVLESTETNRMSALGTDVILYGVVTREPGRLEFLEDVTGGRSEAAVAYLGLAEIPEVAAALNGLDVLVFHGIDTGRLTVGQRDALASWLDTGGLIVATGGPGWRETTAGLAEMLPVSISGTQSVDDIPALRDLEHLQFRDPGPYLIAQSHLVAGEALIHQDGLPLLARQDRGRGSVFFLAFDPSLAPLLDWDGSKTLWSEIANYAKPFPDWAYGARHSYSAANAVSSLPNTDLPAAWALLVFLMIYVVVVGPLNYLILQRWGRRELAWLTIPVLVILFSFSAYIVGFGLKGNETIINQMSIIYGQAEGDQARVQTVIGLYSPRRASYDLTLPAETIPRPFERSFGAMGGRGNVDTIERAEDVTVSGIRVDVGGVEMLAADSYQPLPNVTGSVRLRPSPTEVELEVEVFNNGPVALENASILIGSTALALGDLSPGGRLTRSESLNALATSPAGGGLTGVYVPPPPTTTPLLANQDVILGSTDYYNDREVYSRWQLLQAMAPEYGIGGRAYAPDAFTLIAWSQQPQLELGLLDDEYSSVATSLYFIELPVEQGNPDQFELVVPQHLLNWSVIAEDGVYDARVDDLFLTEGSVEFEFAPWSQFQAMTVTDLSIIITSSTNPLAQQLPLLRLWDWEEENWQLLANLEWGSTVVEGPSRFLGPGNAVRIQLVNSGQDTIGIDHVYPELTGVVE